MAVPITWKKRIIQIKWTIKQLYILTQRKSFELPRGEWYSQYIDWLRAGRSWDPIPLGARFSAPVHTGPEAHPASCTMSTGSFPGVKSGRCVTLTPHPLLVPCSRKGRAIPLLPLWTVRPVQSLSACTRVHFTFFTTLPNILRYYGKSERYKFQPRACNEGREVE